jgi:hypothetical protein
MPLNVLASEQIKMTAETADKIIKLLNYCTMHQEAKLRYHISGMTLNIHSHASYLSEREAKSRSGGFFYTGSNIDNTSRITNGAIFIISPILKRGMSSAEAEIGSVFLNHSRNNMQWLGFSSRIITTNSSFAVKIIKH